MKTSIQKLTLLGSGLSKKDFAFLQSLKTPFKIQEFVDTLPFNFEKKGETYMSPKRVLETHTAHCFEGALLAALALWIQGERPLVLDLNTKKSEFDHVVTLFKRNGYWGAISKTNHAVLRYREPVYKTIRELVMSYFHEYFLTDGTKTLRCYSEPFDLSKHGTSWITEEKELFALVEMLDTSPHKDILTPKQISELRKAHRVERKAGEIVEWKKD